MQCDDLPFCTGCGHRIIINNLVKVIKNPLDYIIVTDIGCVGIIDRNLETHTVHGLHGRSSALGLGISLGLNNSKKKVIVLIGDGGATIGMQHLIEAAHKNVDMTVILFNNMLYGMTGGQPSSLTPSSFKTGLFPEGRQEKGYDFCQMLDVAGANYIERIFCMPDISKVLSKAIGNPGFSFIEVIEICTSHGSKYNKDIYRIASDAGLKEKIYCDKDLPAYRITHSPGTIETKKVKKKYNPVLKKRTEIILSGSAGEGVQTAANIFIDAAMSCGLYVSKKSSYPVTVGTGFSIAEIIISRDEILYTGTDNPDYILITSQDGLSHCRNRIRKSRKARVYIDKSIEKSSFDFRANNPKNAALRALHFLVREKGILPEKALLDSIKNSKIAKYYNDIHS